MMKTNGRGRVAQRIFADQRKIIVFVRLSVYGRSGKIPVASVFSDIRICRAIYDRSKNKTKTSKQTFCW